MQPAVEFWFDFSCPYAYIGSTRIEGLARRTNAILQLKPMLLGGVFRARGTAQNLAGTLSATKARHNIADMQRWAKLAGIALDMPAGHPLRTVDALRCLLAVGQPYGPLMHAFYRAYWVDGIDISTDGGIHSVLNDAGHDAQAVLQKAQTQTIKDDLRTRSDEAIAKGIFGAPITQARSRQLRARRRRRTWAPTTGDRRGGRVCRRVGHRSFR